MMVFTQIHVLLQQQLKKEESEDYEYEMGVI
jgi:hypothetical protein